jgi:hypothetical protein
VALLLWESSTIFVFVKCVFHFSLMCVDVVVLDEYVVPSLKREGGREWSLLWFISQAIVARNNLVG